MLQRNIQTTSVCRYGESTYGTKGIFLTTNITLGERITEARELKGYTLVQAARRAAVATGTFKNWENGLTSPRANKLQMLAGVLGVSLFWLIEGDNNHDPIEYRSTRLDRLEQKMKRLGNLQQEILELSEDIASEIATMRQIDEELNELAA